MFATGGGTPTYAAPFDDVIQPGDPGEPCTAGPVVGDLVFTPVHCGTKRVEGHSLVRVGANAKFDSVWSRPSSASTSLSVNVSTASAPDVVIAGYLRPWIGLPVWKSGATSDITGGEIYGLSGFYDEYMEFQEGFEAHVKVCDGDSGAPVYAEVMGKTYIVGMMTNGDAGTVGTGPCVPRDRYHAAGRLIDDMCTVAGLTDCVNEATRVIDGVDVVVGKRTTYTVSGWAVDASDVYIPVMVDLTVDGVPYPGLLTGGTRNDVVDALHLSKQVKPGWKAVITLPPGAHEICTRARNSTGTGNDGPMYCTKLTVPDIPPLPPIPDLPNWW